MGNLGYLYFKKGKLNSNHQQFGEAAHWFRFAISKDATLRDPNFYIGVMHLNGLGVDKCYKTAYRYFKIAADLGHSGACTKAGDIIYSGLGCLKADKTAAYEWYDQGSQLMNA